MNTDKMKVVSSVIVQHGNKVLMCKRAENQSYGGEWSIPMGHLKKGESPLNGLKREFYEETNIKLTGDVKLIDILTRENGTIIYVYYKNSGKELNPDLENAKDGHEHTECGYFSKNELPFDEDNHDEINEIIRKVLGGM